MSMAFTHNFVTPLPRLEAIRTQVGRFYQTPNGRMLPSVTTVLAETNDFKFGKILDALAEDKSTSDFSPRQVEIVKGWAAKFGGAKAARSGESEAISSNGHSLHGCLEDYVLNRPVAAPHKHFPLFKQVLDDNVDEVYGVELNLYSEDIGLAGTSDLVASWAGQPAIIDYKTSQKRKTLSRVKNYFVQGAMYAVLYQSVYSTPVPNIVILVGDEETNKVTVFAQKTKDYTKLAAERLSMFRTQTTEKLLALNELPV